MSAPTVVLYSNELPSCTTGLSAMVYLYPTFTGCNKGNKTHLSDLTDRQLNLEPAR